jgi:ABC-2 type transport system ATP-binding protein
MQDRLYSRLHRLAATGHTVFFSSHTLGEVEQLCDHVAILREGRLTADESLDSLRTRARRAVTIRWTADANCRQRQAPDFLRIDEMGDHQWHCSLEGSTTELIRWLNTQPVVDVNIGAPDLETLFRGYYRVADDEA